jgi:NAD+ synthase
LERLKIDAPSVQQRLVQFIKDFTREQGFLKVVLGLSGGLDSTVSAFLAVEALGKENVMGVFLPHSLSNPDSLKDARKIAALLDLNTRLMDITPFVDVYQKAFPDLTKVQLGNVMARCRMIVLYQISAEENALILGTSNRSEILLGYGTLHGDLASAFMPLGDLYKTQVRALAEHLRIPAEILGKTPSADLWAGQSDEAELGITYAGADRLFVRWIDAGYTREQLIADGFEAGFVDKVMARVESQTFKSIPPPIPKVTGPDKHHD